MTDDLMERLRATTVWKEYADGSKVTQIRNPDGAEAADRIEALTAENERILAGSRDNKLHFDVLKADYDALTAENERLREKLAAAYIALSGTDTHASDCATSNAPAYEPRPCDCKETDNDRG